MKTVFAKKGKIMLQIQMFGHFRMYDGERMLDEASFRSEMVLKLLTYII